MNDREGGALGGRIQAEQLEVRVDGAPEAPAEEPADRLDLPRLARADVVLGALVDPQAHTDRAGRLPLGEAGLLAQPGDGAGVVAAGGCSSHDVTGSARRARNTSVARSDASGNVCKSPWIMRRLTG